MLSESEGAYSGYITVAGEGDTAPRKFNVVPSRGGVTLLVQLRVDIHQGTK